MSGMAEAVSHSFAGKEQPGCPWVGRSIPRVEDAALLTGRGRFIDDLGVRPGTLHAAIDPLPALSLGAPVLYDGFAGNVGSDLTFRYGTPEQAFASAAHRISLDIRYPRNSCTPIETYGVIADYDPGEDAYDVVASF